MRRGLVAIGLAAAFGGADQYLGSLSAHPSATAVSLLSAPWLLVAFAAGWTQPTPRRAMVLGVVSTIAALGGYWLMTLSPVEGAHLGVGAVRGLLFSQSVLLVGAFVTGPLFGWLGNRWRTDRWRVGALALAGAVCLEPLAHAIVGSAIRSPGVWAGDLSRTADDDLCRQREAVRSFAAPSEPPALKPSNLRAIYDHVIGQSKSLA